MQRLAPLGYHSVYKRNWRVLGAIWVLFALSSTVLQILVLIHPGWLGSAEGGHFGLYDFCLSDDCAWQVSVPSLFLSLQMFRIRPLAREFQVAALLVLAATVLSMLAVLSILVSLLKEKREEEVFSCWCFSAIATSFSCAPGCTCSLVSSPRYLPDSTVELQFLQCSPVASSIRPVGSTREYERSVRTPSPLSPFSFHTHGPAHMEPASRSLLQEGFQVCDSARYQPGLCTVRWPYVLAFVLVVDQLALSSLGFVLACKQPPSIPELHCYGLFSFPSSATGKASFIVRL